MGTGIGTLSTLLGIGGGTLTVPLLVYCNVPIHQAVGTSAACGLPIALAGAIGFAVAGWGEAGLPVGSSGSLLTRRGGRRGRERVPRPPWLPVATLRGGFVPVVAPIGLRMVV